MEYHSYKAIKTILKGRGVKAAVAIQGRPDVQLFVEKSDVIKTIDKLMKETGNKGPVDYNGDEVSFNYDSENRILYIDGGM